VIAGYWLLVIIFLYYWLFAVSHYLCVSECYWLLFIFVCCWLFVASHYVFVLQVVVC